MLRCPLACENPCPTEAKSRQDNGEEKWLKNHKLYPRFVALAMARKGKYKKKHLEILLNPAKQLKHDQNKCTEVPPSIEKTCGDFP